MFSLNTRASPVREELETEQDRIQFASSFILEQLGIEAEAPEAPATYLDTMLEKFEGRFPSTDEFSAYAVRQCRSSTRATILMPRYRLDGARGNPVPHP